MTQLCQNEASDQWQELVVLGCSIGAMMHSLQCVARSREVYLFFSLNAVKARSRDFSSVRIRPQAISPLWSTRFFIQGQLRQIKINSMASLIHISFQLSASCHGQLGVDQHHLCAMYCLDLFLQFLFPNFRSLSSGEKDWLPFFSAYKKGDGSISRGQKNLP